MSAQTNAELAQHAEKIFFAGMLTGYVSSEMSGMGIFGIPRVRPSKRYGFEEWGADDLRTGWELHDSYGVGQGGLSFGMTIITYEEVPIWHMQYWGRYEKRVIPFLKRVLLMNYDQKIFSGGRGPDTFSTTEDSWRLVYLNGADGTFAKFSGVEGIRDVTGNPVSVGFHRYQGGLLIPI